MYLLYVLYRVYVITSLPKRPVPKNLTQESGSCRNLEHVQLPVADLKGYDLIVRGVTALLFCLTKTQLPWLIINSLFAIAIQIMKYLLKFIRHTPYQVFLSFSEFTGLTHSNGGSRMDSLPKKWGKSLLLFAFSLTNYTNCFHSESRLLGL